MPVSKVFARQIFDSRGNPTVEVDVETEKGKFSFGEFLLTYNVYRLLENMTAKFCKVGVGWGVLQIIIKISKCTMSDTTQLFPNMDTE